MCLMSSDLGVKNMCKLNGKEVLSRRAREEEKEKRGKIYHFYTLNCSLSTTNFLRSIRSTYKNPLHFGATSETMNNRLLCTSVIMPKRRQKKRSPFYFLNGKVH